MRNTDNRYVEYENRLGAINGAAQSAPEAFVLRSEREYQEQVGTIAARIAHAESPCKVIMLAGPSSSGKTTTAHMLSDAFREFMIRAEIISLDDFYKGESQAPLLPNGQHDYETVDALDVGQIQKCLLGLMTENHCDMPVFDFTTHTPFPYTRPVDLKPRDIVIVEGIHALNPVISEALPREGLLKAYISVKQGVSGTDGKAILDANEMRLVRRLVRDSNFRQSSAERTLSMWDNVMDGEYRYIKPFRGDADITINSFHLYEPCVLRRQAVGVLGAVAPGSGHYPEARRLLDSMERFTEIDEQAVPVTSMLREFIGGGIYG